MDYIIQYSIYVLILSLLMGVSTWKLFKKMGYNPLFAFIPFYNYYIILKETGHSKWWSILSYFPIVGPIMMTVFHLFLMGKFNKSSFTQKLMTVFLPFIYMAIVNYSPKTELETEEEFRLAGEDEVEPKKETFIGSITFAVVFATLVHVFLAQPFGIPTGSMERTLLVGDFLVVNKWSYGFRMPTRPLAIPFLQGTIFDKGKDGNPKNDPKSYCEAVKLPYWRIGQFNKPKKNEIVVFNYPRDSVHKAIDRKDPYVKRCVAVAGDIIEIKNAELFVNGKPEYIMGDQEQQRAYEAFSGTQLDVNALYQKYGYLPLKEFQTDKGFLYKFQGLTKDVAADIKKMPEIIELKQVIVPKDTAQVSYFVNAERTAYTKKIDTTNSIFPFGKSWNQSFYGPLKIPKKGDVVKITPETLSEYRWIISEYEGNKLETKNGKIFINGQETNQYTIQQDYYMMIGDNRDASLDGRFFGFVPDSHIVGRPLFTWMSLEGAFSNPQSDYQAPFKIRWDRMFKATNTGEKEKTSYAWLAVLILVVFFGWDFIMKLFRKKKEE